MDGGELPGVCAAEEYAAGAGGAGGVGAAGGGAAAQGDAEALLGACAPGGCGGVCSCENYCVRGDLAYG